ncbi:hypothetical protein, partial [Huintestinicola sp.]
IIYYLLLIIQLNLAILNEFIDNKSPFYDYLLNIDHFLWQGLIGGAIGVIFYESDILSRPI